MPNMMKVLVKEPNKDPEVTEIVNDITTLQILVGGYIEAPQFRYEPDILMVCNEEGKLKNLRFNFFTETDVIVGTVVFVSFDNTGELIGLTDEQIKRVQYHFGLLHH